MPRFAAQEPEDAAERAESVWLDAAARAPAGTPDLDELCRLHPELANELQRISSDWGWLERTVTPGREVEEDAEQLKQLVRGLDPVRYTRLEELAQGGGGRIERIWDALLNRSLAMKVARTRAPEERASRSRQLARFLEEAQVTGQLQHPGIVPIHDVGIDDEGFAFFTMDLVEGIDLGEAFQRARTEQGGWTLQRAVRALASVAETLAYAHARGVLHRDVKPSNVRVGPFGEVYVMDWGLARVEGRADAQDVVQSVRSGSSSGALLTAEGAVMGTPAYMPPEQARGALTELDERADVYAVGAMLYELLAERPPYADEQHSKTAEEVAAAVASSPPAALAKLAPAAPPELIAIAERAMARRPADRYRNMARLAEELRAYLEGRVVRAHRTGTLVQVEKWVLRNRLSAAALVLLLVALALAAWIQYDRSRALQVINVDLDAARTEALGEAYFARLAAAQASLQAGSGRAARNHLEACAPELRGWEWHHLQARALNSESKREIHVGYAHPGSFDISSELGLAVGQSLGVPKLEFGADSGNDLILYDLEGGPGELLMPLSLGLEARIVPGTTLLALASRAGLRLFDLEERRTVAEVAEPDEGRLMIVLAVSSDGGFLACRWQNGQIELRDAKSLELHEQWRPEDLTGELRSIALSRSGRHLACIDSTGLLFLMQPGEQVLASLQTTVLDPTAYPPPLAFRGDGNQLALGRNDGTLELFALPGLLSEQSLPAFADYVTTLAYDPAGKQIACGAADGSILVYDVQTGSVLFRGHGHEGMVVDLSWSSDGRELHSASRDGTLRTWRPERGSGFDPLRTRQGADVAFIADSQRDRVATLNTNASMFLWDASTGDVIARRDFTSIPNFAPIRGAFLPDSGDLVVFTRYTGLMRLEAETLEFVAQADYRTGRPIKISRDGRHMAFDQEGETIVLLVADLSLEQSFPGYENSSFAFSADGECLWVGDIEGELRLWSLAGASSEPRASLSFDAGVITLASDGEVLAVGLTDGRIELHSLEDGTPIASLGRNPGSVEVLDFHPHEPLLLSSGSSSGGDVSLRLWDTDARRLRLELRGPEGRLREAAFGGGGSWIAARSTKPRGHVLIDVAPRYRATALVEVARERVRERIEELYQEWPHPDALVLAWEVEPNLDTYEYRAGRAIAFEQWPHSAHSLRRLEQLAREADLVERDPESSATLARYVANVRGEVPIQVTAARVLLLANHAEEAFEIFQGFESSMPDTDPDTARAAEVLGADIESALAE